jgi:hypothetical protein
MLAAHARSTQDFLALDAYETMVSREMRSRAVMTLRLVPRT